ncbi:MAG: hypothetical protein CVU25_09890 [Betaproteobacteria bacterium HGW-Betaproteobacteria-19]|nr:MAG: hypothetical protein CVU25_09890 [Betaproteobacteria bacterium HGW-Betaproteobacteria-19]
MIAPSRPSTAFLCHLCVALTLLAGSAHALAHGLRVTAHAEGEDVVGQALYSDLTPAAGLFVDILDPTTATRLAEGSSGDDGRFRIAVPSLPAYRVVVEGEEGHRAEAEAPRLASGGAVDADALRLLREDIARMEARIRLQDIVGGIGYIFGLAGLTAWFMARRRK